jgi:MoaA/NifB/PqqE/SkfB family radical SAM enzyme
MMSFKRVGSFVRLLSKKPDRVLWIFPLICNLRCNHCDIGKLTLAGKGGKRSDGLTIEENKLVAKRVGEWIGQPYSLSFIAGEPLMHADMLEIIKYASKYNAVCSLTSNGTLIQTKEVAENIVKSDLAYLALSLDGVKAKTHDTSRGVVGVRDKVYKAVELLIEAKRKLKKNNPKIYINAIIMKDNLDELREMIKWAKKMGVEGITFQPLASMEYFSGKSKNGGKWYLDNPQWPETAEVLKLVDDMEKMKADGYPLQNSEADFARFRQYFKDPVKFGTNNVCIGSLKTLVITPKGQAKVCMSKTLGDLLSGDIEKIWNSWQSQMARWKISQCEAQCKILACNKDDFYF